MALANDFLTARDCCLDQGVGHRLRNYMKEMGLKSSISMSQ